MRVFGQVVILIVLGTQARGVNAEPKHMAQEGVWRSQSDVLLRAQPLGLAWLPRVGYRVPFTDSKELLHAGSHVEAGIVSSVSPATLHLGGYFQVVPIAPLVLKIEAQQLRFLGLFGNLRTLESVPDWQALDQPLEPTAGEHATGYKVRAEATLRLFWAECLVSRVIQEIGWAWTFLWTKHGTTRLSI